MNRLAIFVAAALVSASALSVGGLVQTKHIPAPAVTATGIDADVVTSSFAATDTAVGMSSNSFANATSATVVSEMGAVAMQETVVGGAVADAGAAGAATASAGAVGAGAVAATGMTALAVASIAIPLVAIGSVVTNNNDNNQSSP